MYTTNNATNELNMRDEDLFRLISFHSFSVTDSSRPNKQKRAKAQYKKKYRKKIRRPSRTLDKFNFGQILQASKQLFKIPPSFLS